MTDGIYNALERIGNLLRAEERRIGARLGLQPVQQDALHYLSVCNRFSDTPRAVAEYLGLTKGTVSQSLNQLEGKGLIKKVPDSEDRRITHLLLTARGRNYLAKNTPPAEFRHAEARLDENSRRSLENGLKQLLADYLAQSGREGFGACRYCRYNQQTEAGFRCGLLNQPLDENDVALICREYAPAE